MIAKKEDRLRKAKDRMISLGVRELRDFGWPGVNSENILSDQVYSIAFRSSLEDAAELCRERGRDVTAIEELLSEIEYHRLQREEQ